MNINRIEINWHVSYYNCEDCGGYENKRCEILFFDKNNNVTETISRFSDGHMGNGDGYFEFLDMLTIVANKMDVSIIEQSFYNGSCHNELLTTENSNSVGIITIKRFEDHNTYDVKSQGVFQVNGKNIIDREISPDEEAENDFIISCLKNFVEIKVEQTYQNYANILNNLK